MSASGIDAPSTPSPDDWGVTADEARDMLSRQMCPVCGEGPWKSPLNHVARAHGISGFVMRDVCGLTTEASVADPALSERLANASRERPPVVDPMAPKRKPRWTRAGIAKQTASIARFNESDGAAQQRAEALRAARSPENVAKQASSLREWWATASPEMREAARRRLARSAEDLSTQASASWDKRGRQPCGTRAAYRRGCRCEACVAALREYRQAQRKNAPPPQETGR